jgi:preprotein translocase SecE subunit
VNKIKLFFEDARQEFKHVNWPTKQEATRLTVIVIVISLGLAAFLGLFDTIFTQIVESFVSA